VALRREGEVATQAVEKAHLEPRLR
jgi:hypothetical protein